MDADTISTLFCEPVEELRETHISQVYLTKNYALKRKKEVTLPFVDYSTCQMRLQNCLAEIELNRRLSSGVYLGCMVLINDSGRWRWSGSSAWSVEQEIGIASPRYEPLVIMRRLPDTHLLSRLAASGDPRAEDCLPALARKLAGFHRRTALSFSELSDPATVLRLAGDNFRELEGLELNKFTSEGSALAYSLSKRYTERFITDGAASISARARAGCISDGHGDLRLEHVSLEPDGRIQIIDCVEFDAGLRRLDRLCDLAFLLMDLDHSSRPDLTARLLSEYCTGIDEDRPAGVLQFFKCYRAMIRAKVHLIRASQKEVPAEKAHHQLQAERYLGLASRYTRKQQGALMVVICGLMGVGKSTLAGELSKLLAAEIFSADRIRKRIFGIEGPDRSPFGEGIYSKEATEATYSALMNEAERSLSKCNPVILDASFSRREFRSMAAALAAKYGAQTILVHCSLDRQAVLRRLASRSKDPRAESDGRAELFDQQRATWEAIAPHEFSNIIELDLSEGVKKNLALVWGGK